jgi:hypothetical protein
MSDHLVPGTRVRLEDANVRATRQGTVDARGVGPSGRYRLRCVVTSPWQPARVPAVRRGRRVDADHCAGDADPGILRATSRSRGRITDPLAVRDAGAGWSWRHRYGGASRVRKSIVPPGCRAGGPGASALREGGLTGSPDEWTIQACGSAVTGPGASAGLTRFAPSGLRPGGGGAATRHPGYRSRRRLALPAGSGTAVSAAGLRG